MKSTRDGLLGAIFAGAMAACSATWCQASTIVNFDSVDTSGGPVSGAPVTSYLSGFGITFSSVVGTPFILPYEPGNPFPVPVSSPNWFGVGGPSGFNYAFLFSNLLDSVSFTVPGTGNGSTMAAWSATAYSAANVQLDQVGNPNVTSPGSSTQTYTLTGPAISYVVFFDDAQGFAGNHLALDDVTLSQTPLPAALSLFASGLGVMGLLGWRRKKKAAALVKWLNLHGRKRSLEMASLGLSLAVAVVAPMSCTAGAATITNGDFETPSASASPFYVDFLTGSGSLTGWNVVSGDVAIVSNNFPNLPAESGSQWLDLTGVDVGGGGISQSIATVSGQQYSLSFWVGNATSLPGTTSTVNVQLNGNSFFSATNSDVSDIQTWKQFSKTFTATGSSTLIGFSNGDPINDVNNGLDNITINAVSNTPLPAALPLFASGLGALGLVGWRRKKKAAALAA